MSTQDVAPPDLGSQPDPGGTQVPQNRPGGSQQPTNMQNMSNRTNNVTSSRVPPQTAQHHPTNSYGSNSPQVNGGIENGHIKSQQASSRNDASSRLYQNKRTSEQMATVPPSGTGGPKIKTNINGIKPMIASNNAKQRSGGGPNHDQKQQVTAVLGNMLDEAYVATLGTEENGDNLGTQNYSLEDSQLISPSYQKEDLRLQPKKQAATKPIQQVTNKLTAPNSLARGAGADQRYAPRMDQDSYPAGAQHINLSPTKINSNRVAPMPIQTPKLDDKKIPFGGQGLGGGLAKSGRQTSFKFDKQDQGLIEKEKALGPNSNRQDAVSILSSLDYVDVDLNNALNVMGMPANTGRGKKFVAVKHFKEDNWSADESIYTKQMKMPNVNAAKNDYQVQIGLNLDYGKNRTPRLDPEAKGDDTIQEAREMIPEAAFYKIIEKDRIQIIDDYHDRCPFLDFRKKIMKARVYINRGAQMIMMHSLFESISISVIIVNSIFLAMDDPLRDPSETPQFMNTADDIFQYLYTIEMVVKIVSLGFILNEGSYLRDAWNILDFVIIASGYMGMFLQGSGVNLSALRSFRVIRPLRTISSVQGLRVIVSALINAIPLLRDSLLVLLFFFLVFAIAGCQLFTGALKNRCFNEDTGVIDTSFTVFCGGGNSCRPGYYCAKSNQNPANGATNFDNVMFSLLQVFQVVTMEGWTAIMVALMQSVGTWIFIYFYPIIFIGAFFLLNLTLAVIKAKFTEEMNNKQENPAPAKKKKLDDAPLSSEDEDQKAMELQVELDKIKASKNMSPRTKENKINKLKVEYMIRRIDNAFVKREIEHKIVEKEDEEEILHQAPGKSQFVHKSMISKSKKLTAAEKIQILNPPPKVLFATQAATVKSITKPIPGSLNYKEVFYSNKKTVLTLGGAGPGKELMDIFGNEKKDAKAKGATDMLAGETYATPIKEDEEENNHELDGLISNDNNDFNRRHAPRRVGINSRKSGQNVGALTDVEDKMNKSGTVSKWLGKVFEVARAPVAALGAISPRQQKPNDTSLDLNATSNKKLKFAGMNNVHKKINPAGKLTRSPETDEHTKRAIYDNITRNFDIFEFLDDEQAQRQNRPIGRPQAPGDEGDHEMSDDLEFHIEDADRRIETMFYDTQQQTVTDSQPNPGQSNIIDRNNLVSREGVRPNTQVDEDETRVGGLKRGSTQATAAENGTRILTRSLLANGNELEMKYMSPFMQQLQKSQVEQKKKKKYPTKEIYPEVNYRGSAKGLMALFRACKRIQVRTGRDFKEEYILLRKRARSLANKEPQEENEFGQKTQDDQNMTMNDQSMYGGRIPPISDTNKSVVESQKNMTIRAKSVENKQKQILAATLKFKRRINLMNKRRAQYFAPAVKLIEADLTEKDKKYEEYVFNKHKIKIDPLLIDESTLRKRILYRSPSAEAILRHKEYHNLRGSMMIGKSRRVQKIHAFDLHAMQDEEGGSLMDIETQRSQPIEKDYMRVVLQHQAKQQEIERFHEHEHVPHLEDIMQEKKLKIVVKMSNLKFSSINDIFEKSGPGRFMSEREKFLLEQERKKKEALKLKLPERVEARDIILGYQKKIHYAPKDFHEDLLRTEFVPSDEDQDGMLGRIEDDFNYDHRSHIFVTGTVSVVVNKPHHDNKIMNANYHANIRAIERDQEWEKEMIEIETTMREKEAAFKKPGIVIMFDEDKPDYSAWKNHLPTYSIQHQSMHLRNASKFILSRKAKDSMSQSGMSENQQKGFDPIHPPPKPEPLNDKQILRYLNFECKKSRIFNMLNIKTHPHHIYREAEPEKFKIRGRKKKEEEEEDDQDGSDGEIVELKKNRRIDYFLDRKFEGEYHIDMAKGQAFKRPRDTIEWSGQDVMSKLDPYKMRLAIAMLDQIRVWPYAIHGFIKKRRITLRQFMNSPVVEHGMTTCVLGNTVVLSLDYYGASQAIQDGCATANTFFTLIFAIEMFSRILAIGPAKWGADKMNYMDGTIVLLSLVEMIFMSGSGALSALRAVRIFRVFRVLRVARLLRGLKSMLQIINVIQRSISSFIYLAMLLMLFVFIYALLGMQVFGGSFTDPEVVGTIRYNYDSFLNAFITSFIMLTTENWNSIMFYAFSGTTSQALIAVYFISCIFVGNWMLLNLFLAILLDSFTQVEEEDMMTPEKKERIKQGMLDELKIKEGEDFVEGMLALQKESFDMVLEKPNKKKKKKKKKAKSNSSASTSVNKSAEDKKPQGNILEESQEIDLQELAKRDEMKLAERKQLFRGIECENSIYLFSKKNWIRILAYKTVHHGKFESVIMILIVGSSFKLVFDTYTDKLAPDDPIIKYSSQLDLVFQIAFTIEMTLKILAFGFTMDENSYLTESWSQMDFFIVTTGLIDTSLEGVDIAFLKVLRLLRILRPLRFLSHSSSMKTLIEALMASIPSILNVGVVIVVVFLMFAILGVNLFAGKLQYCTVGFYKINDQEECFKARGQWQTYVQNMDNVVRGMMTLFAVSNNEGWPDVMYAYSDATGVETGPKPGAGIINAFYFILFVFIGSFFFLNLFTGVLFLNFEKAQRDEKDAMLLDGDEIKWVDMMKMICDEKPEIVKIPKNPVRLWCYNLVRDEGPFANFIMACIILNIFTMAATFEGQSDSYSNVLEKINYFFTAAFAIECFTKLIAYAGNYFDSGWNKFDFFVVSASFLDIVMANMSANSLKVIRVGPQLARIMRVMRVSRLFKLLNKYKGLQALIQTITFSMPSVINAFALLSLVYFIFSVLAVFFFKDVTSGINLDSYMNFTNFTQSLVMMLRLSTGEDWPMVMYDLMNTNDNCIPGVNCGTGYAPIFFIMFVLIQQYIMVDLFVLIILQQFDLYYLPDDNVLDRFKNDVTSFKYTWKRFSADFEGFKIRGNDVLKFFKELKGDLGMSAIKDKKTIERELVMMNIQADEDGFIYFNELLYKTMKRRYAYGRTKKKVLFELELDTLEKLEKISAQQIFLSRKKERQKAVAVNPFMSMMYKNMSFNVWKEMYQRNLPKRQQHMQLGLEREISDEEEEEEEDENQYEYVYETEEIEEIDEQEQMNPVLDEFADDGKEEDPDLLFQLAAAPHPNDRSRGPNGSRNYDQLRQEDEILGGLDHSRKSGALQK